MNISIFGLGYVGAVSSACLAEQGHRVIGVDVNDSKIKLINNGNAPIVEAGLEQMIKNGVVGKRLHATNSIEEAVKSSEVSIICVGTPSLMNGNINLSYIYSVCEEIAHEIRKKESFHSVVIRSTVKPGTLQTCGEIIEDISGKKINVDFGMASNPEFLREGTAIHDYFNPPYTIFGCSCTETENQLREIYANIDAPIYSLKPKESEMIKYANNSFHALKITFANEIGNISKELGIDGHVVMDIVTKDKKLNLSSYYMRPGFAFGGSCLPKDVRELNYSAKSLDLSTPMLDSLLASNENQIDRAFRMIERAGSKKVGFLGFSFKAGTDDLRESPVLTLIEKLIGKGYELKLYDSNIILSKLTGKNKEFLHAHLPHINKLLETNIEDVINGSEVLVIGTKEDEFKKVVKEEVVKTIIDLVRIDKEKVSGGNYVGICW